MPRGQETANNGINPETLPQLKCPFSRRPLFIITILTTVCVLLIPVITLILLYVDFNAGTPFSETEQKELVDFHNWLRGNVTPPAKDMQKMVWDNDIAKWAQKVANRCKGGHVYQDTNIGWVGQNMHSITPRHGFGVGGAAVEGWWIEGKHYTYANNSCADKNGKEQECGHYTQLVWATSNKVGCARSVEGCDEGFTIVVCNYYPPGNVVGGKVAWLPYTA